MNFDWLLHELRSQGVDRKTVALVLQEFESAQIELQELRESRMNLAVLAEELKAQAETIAEERDQLLAELHDIENEFKLEHRRAEKYGRSVTLSPDALMVLRVFCKNPEHVQTFSSLRRELGVSEAVLLEAVNELGMSRYLSFGQDMGRPEEFAVTPKGREYFMDHLGKRGAA